MYKRQAAETHNYDTENLPHDGADYFETEIKADEENEERISDFEMCIRDSCTTIKFYAPIILLNSSNRHHFITPI